MLPEDRGLCGDILEEMDFGAVQRKENQSPDCCRKI